MNADDANAPPGKSEPRLSRAGGPPPWPFTPWAVPVMLVAIYWMWWDASAREFARAMADVPSPGTMGLGQWFMVGGKAAAHALEALWYAMLWRGRGVRLRITWLFTWNATLSLLDLAALSLAGAAGRADGASLAILALLAGPAALGEASPLAGAGVRAALGGAGLLAALRLLGLAYTLRRVTRRGIAGPLTAVGASWLASRVALAWAAELAQGRSPLP